MRHLLALMLVATVGLLALSAGCDQQGGGDAAQRYVMVSGGQSGVYFPTAGAIARLASKADPAVQIDVQTSGGSVENARLIGGGDAQFAIMQNDIAAYALEGKLMFDGKAIDGLVGVAALYPEHIQIVAHADAGIAGVADLKGKKVAIGAIGSGTEANAKQILEAYGMTVDDLGQVQRLNASESRDYLQDQRVDAAFFTFGVGTAAIKELAMVAKVSFVPVDGEGRDKLMAAYPFYRKAEIPADAYEGMTAAVPTVSVMATLVTRKDVPDTAVTAVLKGVFDHVDEFRKTHARLAQVNRERGKASLTLPAHPAVAAFFAKPAASTP